MTPIHDRNGRVVGWLYEGRVLDLRGHTIGILNGDVVYDNSGRERGRFTTGFFRDRQGDAVAFVPGASGGPIPPIPQIPPVPPLPSIPPIPAIPNIPNIPPIPSLRWSAQPFQAVFG